MPKQVIRTRKSLPAPLLRPQQGFLSHVPGTRQFRRRYQIKILKDARIQLKRFDDLKVLNAENKRRLLRPVRHCVNLLAAIDRWRNGVVKIAIAPFIMLALLGIWVGPLVITKIWLKVSYSVLGWVGVFYLYLLFFLLAGIIAFPAAIPPIAQGMRRAIWVIFATFRAIAEPSRQTLLSKPEKNQMSTAVSRIMAPLAGWARPRSYLHMALMSGSDLPAQRAFDYLAPSSLVLTWLCSVVAIYVALVRYTTSVPQTEPTGVLKYVAVSGMTGVVLYLVILLPAVIVVTPIQYALKRRRNAMHPDAVLVTGLLGILWRVELLPAKWTDLHFKQELLARLEEVASCVQHDLPRMLATRDVATDLWLRARADQMAAALRALKKWVSTPMADTRDRFIAAIADSFVHASTGDWDALARMEVEQISRPEFRSRVLAGVRVLLIALLPMAGLWILQWTPLALDTPASGYARAGVFVWFALTVLAALDPLLGAKLAAFKDVSAVLPLPGKK